MNKTTGTPEKSSVLIVDDEKANLIALTHMLNKEYTVYAAKNGHEALEAAREHHPDVILLDILMPEMDGYEVINNLKNSEETKTIPVIFITGLSSAADEEKGLLLGASDYISKPLHNAIVLLRVRNQIQLSCQFNKIRTLSVTDELTNLFNRRGFDSRLHLEWNHAKRDQTPLGLLIIDIDFFKKYNDEYGHLQGDEVLKTVAKVLESTLKRSVDFPARWGGEEFAVLLPGTELNGALIVAERIRKNIEKEKISCTNGDITRITVSIGVNVCLPKQDISIQNYINEADNALYEAKRTGRNKVCKFESVETKKGQT